MREVTKSEPTSTKTMFLPRVYLIAGFGRGVSLLKASYADCNSRHGTRLKCPSYRTIKTVEAFGSNHFKGEIMTKILLERVRNCPLFTDVNNS